MRSLLSTYLQEISEPNDFGLRIGDDLTTDDDGVALIGLAGARFLHEHRLFGVPAR